MPAKTDNRRWLSLTFDEATDLTYSIKGFLDKMEASPADPLFGRDMNPKTYATLARIFARTVQLRCRFIKTEKEKDKVKT